MSDNEARGVLIEAFELKGIRPTLAELQAVQAIARFEGGYGGGWRGAGVGSNNWGAIQCGHYAPCKAGCFQNVDTHASGEAYQGCFRIYATPAEGAAGLIHELYRREGVPEAMRAGDATRIADRMRATGYFEAPATKYALAIENNAADIARSLQEGVQVRRGGVSTGPTTGPDKKKTTDGSSYAAPLLFAAMLFGIARWKTNARKAKYT
jgi:hypothetical protein